MFILAKINYALKDTITSSRGLVTLPAEGSTAEALVLAYDGAETYAFTPILQMHFVPLRMFALSSR